MESNGVIWDHFEKSKIRKLQNQKIKFRQFIIHVQSDFWRLVMKIIILADVAKIISRKFSQKLLRFCFRNSDFSKNFKEDEFFEFSQNCPGSADDITWGHLRSKQNKFSRSSGRNCHPVKERVLVTVSCSNVNLQCQD